MLVPLLLSVRPHATPRSAARQLLMCSDKPDGETFNVNGDTDDYGSGNNAKSSR